MAKDKKASKAAAVAPKPALSKPMESVKTGRVTKPAESAKKASKDSAKKVVKEAEKKKKKVVKEPTPEPSSADDEEMTSASSDSSDDENDSEVEAKPKMNGKAKPAAVKDDDSSDGSSDSDDEPAPKTAAPTKTNGAAKADADSDDDSSSASSDDEAAPKMNGKAAASSDDEDSEDDSDDSAADSDSDSEVDSEAGAGKLAADTEMADGSSGSDSSDDEEEAPKAKTNGNAAAADSDSDSDVSGSDDSEDESKDEKVVNKEKPMAEAPSKKRKADESVDKTPKKTKVVVDGEEKEASANLFIGNLSWNIDEEWLTREFEDFGEIQGVRIITDRDSGRSKGFGYVEFTETSNAIKALEAKTGSELDGRNIRIDFSTPRAAGDSNKGTPQQRSNDRANKFGDTPSQPSNTIFVGNVSFDADESTLTEAFEEYGSIKSIRIPTDRETGNMKGFAYVEFDSIDEAKAAREGLNGQYIANRAVRLDFATVRDNNAPRGGGGGGFGGRGGGRGRGGFGDRGGRGGGRGGFGDRGRGGRGGSRGGSSFNRGGFGDFSGKKTKF